MSCQCNFSLGVTLLTKQLKNINCQALLQLNKGHKLKHIAWLCGRVLNLIGTCCPGSKMGCDQDAPAFMVPLFLNGKRSKKLRYLGRASFGLIGTGSRVNLLRQ